MKYVRAAVLCFGVCALVLPAPARGDSERPLRCWRGWTSQGLFAWNLYAQGRYTYRQSASDLYALRRLKLRVHGRLPAHTQYRLQGIFKDGNDSATDAQPYLQDAWVAWARWPAARFRLGQFIPPFSLERFTPDAELFSIDRAQVTDHLIPDGKLGKSFARDRGLQIDGRLQEAGMHYALGVFQGRAANTNSLRFGPLGAGQLTVEPIRQQSLAGRPLSLHFGGAFAVRRGRHLNLSGCCPGEPTLRRFSGRDTRFNFEFAGDWGTTSLRAEYFQAHFSFLRGRDGRNFTASGFYVQAAHYLTRAVQVVAKFETFDPNRRVRNTHDIRWTTLGVNYYIRGDRLKVMVDYVFKNERADAVRNDALLVQLQVCLSDTCV